MGAGNSSLFLTDRQIFVVTSERRKTRKSDAKSFACFWCRFWHQHVLSRFRHVASEKKHAWGLKSDPVATNSPKFQALKLNGMGKLYASTGPHLSSGHDFLQLRPLRPQFIRSLEIREWFFSHLYEFEFVPIGQILRGIYVSPMIDLRSTHLTPSEDICVNVAHIDSKFRITCESRTDRLALGGSIHSETPS